MKEAHVAPNWQAAAMFLKELAEKRDMSHLVGEGRKRLEAASEALAAALPLFKELLLGESGGAEVDAFGGSAPIRQRMQPLLDWLYEGWLHVEARGFEHLPREGPLLLVANRAGLFPWDALMLAEATRRHGRELRPLIEDPLFYLPYLGLLANRLGLVRASPENAAALLGEGGAAAVFPEGASGYGKPYRERYQLKRFGRGGFVRLALRNRATVLPVAIVGSEEASPLLGRIPWRPAGLPFLPLTPTFPWLGPLGLLPLPFPWRIQVAPPLDWSAHPPEAAEDEALVSRLREEARQRIQDMLDEKRD